MEYWDIRVDFLIDEANKENTMSKPTLAMASRQALVQSAVDAVVAAIYTTLSEKSTVAEAVGVLEMAKLQIIKTAEECEE